MKTPVWPALAALIVNIAINLYVVSRYGIVGLAGAPAVSASLNCLLLYAMLHRRGCFRFTAKLALPVGARLVAVAPLAPRRWGLLPHLAAHFGGPVFEHLWSLAAPSGAGGAVFLAPAFQPAKAAVRGS